MIPQLGTNQPNSFKPGSHFHPDRNVQKHLTQARSIFLEISKKPYISTQQNLGGGFKYFFIFTPTTWEDEPILTCAYLFKWVCEKSPPRNVRVIHFNFCSPICFPRTKKQLAQLFPTFDFQKSHLEFLLEASSFQLCVDRRRLVSGVFIWVYGISHTIHVWYIYLHLVDFYGKCR